MRNPTNRVDLGRTTAIKTFTRNSNLPDEPRNCRQAKTLTIATNCGCVAWFKQPLALAFTLALTALLFSVTSAFAAPYKYEKAQSEELSKTVPGGAFTEPYGLAFDSAENLFVADAAVPFPGENKVGAIDIFDSSNVFSSQIDDATVSPENPFTGAYVRSVTVDNLPGPDQGMVYVGESNHEVVDVFKPEGGGKYKLVQERRFPENYVTVAFDNSTGPNADKLYVLEKAKLVLVTLNADGTLPTSETEPGVTPLESPGTKGFGNGQEGSVLAVGATGKLYLANPEEKVVDVYSSEDVLEAPLTGPSSSGGFKEPIAVAVDSATGDVFVVDKEGFGENIARTDALDEFGPSGEFLNQIAETGPNELFGKLKGVAVQEAGPHAGDVYVADAKDKTVDVFAELVPAAPRVEGEGVQQVTGDSASFVGEINPHGAPTEYRFEYGPCPTSSSCASSPYPNRVPVPDGSLGAEDFTTHTTTSFHVQGLSAGTTYHFLVVAHNEVNGKVEVGEGEERMFTTQGASGEFALPDDRAWELVSPPDKHGGVLSQLSVTGVVQASVGGDAISYLANGPTEAAPAGDAGAVQVLSTRGSGGWGYRDIATAHEAATGSGDNTAPEYRFFSEDLSSAVVQPFGRFNPALSAQGSEQTPYLRSLTTPPEACNPTSSCFVPLVTAANVEPAGTKFAEERLCEENNGGPTEPICGPQFQGASPDASHIVLRSAAPLMAGAPRNELYEWSAGKLALVSVLPQTKEQEEKDEELPASEPLLGTQFGANRGSARRAISSDGSRVFFEAEEKLFVRDSAIGKSLQIDASEAGCPQGSGEDECEEGGAGRFQVASADGSRVYFTDTHRLTKDSGAKGGQVNEPDLYECKIVEEPSGKLSCVLADLTPREGGENANVQGDVLGASEDGSSIYFVADGALARAGAQRGTCRNHFEVPQQRGATCNLYERHDGQGTRFVASLSGGDATVWTQRNEHQPTRVSPSGQWLAFMSERPLTGYDNADAVSGKPDAEVFLYDASGAGHLSCASCDPRGARPVGVEYGKLESGVSEVLPNGREEWEDNGWVAALPPHTAAFGVNEPGHQPDYLSNSGRLFFNTLDALVPQDVNGTGDVYEYEPQGYTNEEGTEQCSETTATFASRSAGCIGLISSGTSAQSSAFLDASKSGGDVFFLTSSKLTPEDIDTRKDVYDAHECTVKSPCIPPAAVPPPPCNTEASCKPSPAPPPSIFGAPPSATFNGAGNLTPLAAVKVKAKPLTRAQKLSKALATCHRDKRKAKRSACEKSARKSFGPVKRAKQKQKRRR